jgi:hypothetical protein
LYPPASVSILQHTSAYVELVSAVVVVVPPCIRHYTSAYVRIRPHTSAYVTSDVSIR